MEKRLLELEEVKRIQLEILDGIDCFCKANGLRYSLAYGSLLGAVRHKGYIPWDDDIDIMMARPDYERFREVFKVDGLYLADLEQRDDCVEAFVKVCKKDTEMVDKSFGRIIWGINVDVFPIDGAPERDLDRHYASLDRIREKLFQICPYYKSVRKGRFSLMLKYVLKRFRYFYPGSFKSLKQKFVDGQKIYPYESSEIVGIYFNPEKARSFMKKQVYSEIGILPFEGKSYSALINYDAYLTNIYGAYMQFPPEEKRVCPHFYDSFIFEK